MDGLKDGLHLAQGCLFFFLDIFLFLFIHKLLVAYHFFLVVQTAQTVLKVIQIDIKDFMPISIRRLLILHL